MAGQERSDFGDRMEMSNQDFKVVHGVRACLLQSSRRLCGNLPVTVPLLLGA